MRLPNGFGNVSKLPGNRRKPFRARVTTGFEYLENGKSRQLYKTVGYYETREAALIALSLFHQNPYDLNSANITFEELFKKWSAEHFPKISLSKSKGYTAAFNHCTEIYSVKFTELKRSHLQGVIDNSGKNFPTLNSIKQLFTQLFKYAMQNDICMKNYASYVDVIQYKDRNPKKLTREPFSSAEVETLWSLTNGSDLISFVLMLIYTGVRISEMLDLTKDNVNLEERYIYIGVSNKTEAGFRYVPIADKVFPFFVNWYNKNECKYLFSSEYAKHISYMNLRNTYWTPLMKKMGMEHNPHDTRHTCISMLALAKVDDKIIRKIVGHKGGSITESVYTHFDLKPLSEAINKI